MILSVGFPKSGSAWYYNLTNDLLVAGGGHDARMVRDRYELHSIMKFGTCNIQSPTQEKLLRLTSPPLSDYTFAVKTHAPPSEPLLGLLGRGRVKATYIYRDPRDVAVSGLEEGEKLRRKGKLHRAVTKLRTMGDAILWSESWLRKSWDRWKDVRGVLRLRYEDLLARPEEELKRLTAFLSLRVGDGDLARIIDNWRPENLAGGRKNAPLHFNKGMAGRFRSVMSPDEQRSCLERWRPILVEMGYLS